MENKYNNKKCSNFFKRKGMYIGLVLCLCIFAAVAALLPGTNKNNQQASKNNNMQSNKRLAENDKKIDNAIQVKRNSNIEAKNNKINERAVSNIGNIKFLKPVDGKIVMKYSQTPLWWDTSKSYRPNFGINIKANIGSPVKSVAQGEVKNISKNGTFGVSVSIYHPQNGKTTVYGNLDKSLKIKKGDKVTQGQQIGKIGKTSVRGMSEEVGNNFLHFEVLKSVDGDPQFISENPEKYVKY